MGAVTLGRSIESQGHTQGFSRTGSMATASSQSVHHTSHCDTLWRGAEAGRAHSPATGRRLQNGANTAHGDSGNASCSPRPTGSHSPAQEGPWVHGHTS